VPLDFSTEYRFDVVAAGVSGGPCVRGRLEHMANSVVGVPIEPYTLRVTHVFRRENGEWMIADRHADYVPIDQTLASGASTTQLTSDSECVWPQNTQS
jgi:hypothetical protein